MEDKCCVISLHSVIFALYRRVQRFQHLSCPGPFIVIAIFIREKFVCANSCMFGLQKVLLCAKKNYTNKQIRNHRILPFMIPILKVDGNEKGGGSRRRQ